ncbi:hypothetical protein ACPPVO_14655 [Dactylosporangium sp. McL0621]|uniref:hypothetical protein n=1 Tax=Dactylosporangium sp. McL0621 TaxID=3415678 RepID=UPI003CF39B8A
MSSKPGGWAYLPGLDGVRALAVLAVVVFHARPGWLPGGFLGVDAFDAYLVKELTLAIDIAAGNGARVVLLDRSSRPWPPASRPGTRRPPASPSRRGRR